MPGLFEILSLLSFLILLIAFAMIANERKKEFALLRLLGTSRKQLGLLVWKESALCSLAGGLTGIARNYVLQGRDTSRDHLEDILYSLFNGSFFR